MILKLFARNRPRPVPRELYGLVVAQARDPRFYEAFGVPDTVAGRFDMVCLHVYLLTRRLAGEPGPLARSLSQELFDEFTRDLEASLRELGVGDTSVPKRMKRMVRGYYAQIEAFDPPLASADAATLGERAGARFAPSAGAVAAGRFASYLMQANSALARQPFDALAQGRLEWPAPAVADEN